MFWRDHLLRGHKRRLQSQSTRRLAPAARIVDFERLEQRRVLTGVTFSAGLLTVDGTSGNDIILIAPTSDGTKVQVTLNNQVISNSIALSTITQVQVNSDDGNDLITIKSIDKPVTVDGGTGTNELNIVGHSSSNAFVLDTSSVQVNGSAYSLTNVQLLTVNGQNANDTFTVNNFPAISTTIDGAGGVNTLQGPNVDSTWNIQVTNGGNLNSTFHFGNIQSLTGGSGDDTFLFSAGKTIGSTIDGGGGSNSISFADYTSPVTVNLQTKSSTGIGRFQDIQSIEGGAGKDTLIGPNQSNMWDITAANALNIVGVNIAFSSFENLTGGTLADDFQFSDGSFVTGKVDGGAGSNEIDFSAYSTPVTFNLQYDLFSGINSGTFARVQNIVGSATADTSLVGPNATTIWNIANPGGINTVTVSGIAFTNIDDLTGGTGNDTFSFSGTSDISGAIDGGVGTNLLKYSLYTGPITVNLTTNTATAVGSFANLEGVIGTSGTSDTLIGPDLGAGVGNVWTITANNAGNINGTFTFSSIENLTGGPENDTFTFANGKGVSGQIDGGDTTNFNTLDYSAYTTAINVNLTTGVATNIGGSVINITDILGGSGNDVLTGNTNGNLIWGNGGNDIINGMGGNDILVGGSGNDTITAGAGENLLLGGSGSDIISGGTGQDILFNGTTSFDNDGTTQNLILTFWANTAVSFATRVSELRAGTTGVTGMPTLDSTNVFNDTSSDTLTGGGGLDWFFAKLSGTAADNITDLAGGDALN